MRNILNLCCFLLVAISFLTVFNSCKKEKPPVVETGTMKDIDGNVYKTIKIGDQWWMAENLRVSRYRNGDSILYIGYKGFNFDTEKWIQTNSGAYCIIDNYDQNAQNYQGKKFGFLYNFYSVKDLREVAPQGWHIPSDEEWKVLESYLGISADVLNNVNFRGTNEGDKLKAISGWTESYDRFLVYPTNESGFSALGGGCCMYTGVWGNPGIFKTGFWWSSTQKGDEAWYRYLDYNKSDIFRFYGQKTYGFSIRCIKD